MSAFPGVMTADGAHQRAIGVSRGTGDQDEASAQAGAVKHRLR